MDRTGSVKEIRALRVPGAAGARAVSAKRQAGSMFGDAALLDFGTGFFAVSDSPDRNPSASKRLMKRFAEMLKTVSPIGRPAARESTDHRRRRDSLITGAETILENTPSHESCTFTGILVSTGDGMRHMCLLHTGDSVLLEYSKESRGIRQLSSGNFWMVGRTRRFYQVDDIPVRPECVYILATDGMLQHDLLGQPPCTLPGDTVEFMGVEDVPDSFFHANRDRIFHDDITIVSLDPRGLDGGELFYYIEEIDGQSPILPAARAARARGLRTIPRWHLKGSAVLWCIADGWGCR